MVLLFSVGVTDFIGYLNTEQRAAEPSKPVHDALAAAFSGGSHETLVGAGVTNVV